MTNSLNDSSDEIFLDFGRSQDFRFPTIVLLQNQNKQQFMLASLKILAAFYGLNLRKQSKFQCYKLFNGGHKCKIILEVGSCLAIT